MRFTICSVVSSADTFNLEIELRNVFGRQFLYSANKSGGAGVYVHFHSCIAR